MYVADTGPGCFLKTVNVSIIRGTKLVNTIYNAGTCLSFFAYNPSNKLLYITNPRYDHGGSIVDHQYFDQQSGGKHHP